MSRLLSVGLGSVLAGCAFDDSGYTDFEAVSLLTLDDFAPAEGSDYFEVRRGPDEEDTAADYKVMYRLDEAALKALSAAEQEAVVAASSTSGFVTWCLPGSCGVYAVSILDGAVTVVDSDDDLLAFLGPLDTPAEVWLWLLAYEVDGVRYLREDSGDWSVIAEWDNYCGTRKTILYTVGMDGSVTEKRTIEVEEYDGCA